MHIWKWINMYAHVCTFQDLYLRVCTWYVQAYYKVCTKRALNMYLHCSDVYVR
jgi:hypothetical protein